MRILLVQSWLGRDQPPAIPLGLASLAGSWSDRHELRILDPNIPSATGVAPLELVDRGLRDFQPDLVGLSLRNVDTTQIDDRFSFLSALRAQLSLIDDTAPHTPVALGGAGFSLYAEPLFSSLSGTYSGVVGEAESTDPEALARTTGLLRGSGCFGRPVWELLDLEAYRLFQQNLAVGVEVSRGCARKCSYCAYPSLGGPTVRHRQHESVISDLEYLHEKGGIDHFFLVSSLLNSSVEYASGLCAAIRDSGLGITWEAYHTPDNLNLEYLELAKDSGCRGMSISPDGGTGRALLALSKGFEVSDVSRALSLIRQVGGIRVSLNLFPIAPGTGWTGMLGSFIRGWSWGRTCGPWLRRLRFGLIRRLPSTRLADGVDDLLPDSSEIPDACFLGREGIAFRLLSRLLEKRPSS